MCHNMFLNFRKNCQNQETERYKKYTVDNTLLHHYLLFSSRVRLGSTVFIKDNQRANRQKRNFRLAA